MRRAILAVAIVFLLVLPSLGQGGRTGKAQGAVVIREGSPIYADSTGEEVKLTTHKGDWVAGVTTFAASIVSFAFEKQDGRVHVVTIQEWSPGHTKGIRGWMNPADLSQAFRYECGCGVRNAECSPFQLTGNMGEEWNTCFEEGAEKASGGGGSTARGPQAATMEAAGTAHVSGAVEHAPSAESTACGKSFTSSGSMLRGTTYTAAMTYPSQNRNTVFQRLLTVIPDQKLEVVSNNVDSGGIQAQGKSARGRAYTLNFTVADASPGSRVGVVMKIPIGLSSDDDSARNEICQLLEAVQATSPAVALSKSTSRVSSITITTAESGAAKPSIEERLKKLEELHKKGLISDDEYKKKRAEILKDL